MLNQDGELNPHHHHYHRHQSHQNHLATGRGPPRHRRRHPSSKGQGQSPVKGPPTHVGVSRDVDPHRGQQPRPAVARYRRHGDPTSRLRGHKRYQPVTEVQDSFPGEELLDEQSQPQPSAYPVTEERGSPHHTPVAVDTSTHLADASVSNFHSPPPEAEDSGRERKNTFDQEWLEVEKKEVSRDPCSPTRPSSCGIDVIPTVNDRGDKQEGVVGQDCNEESHDAADTAVAADADTAAQKCEMTDLYSDTESAASLSMDGPLHSPPPLQSPTPPSSPDVLHFPKMDNFSEDTSLSTLPDIDMLPEDNEDRSKSCSPSLFTLGSESYPKTYADFCSESYQTSEPVLETQLEPKVHHPNSVPQPLKTSFPDLHREPQKKSGWKVAPNEIQQTFTSHRHEDVQKGAWSPSTKVCQSARRQGRDPGSLSSSADRSVGCRLHHYDSKSDSEGDSGSKSPVTKSRKHAIKKAETLDKSPASVQSTSSEAQEEQDQAEDSKETGDAIIVAIKAIRNAIEEVKIKAVRSPYTPDKSEEPVWVMRQEISPTEEGQLTQTTANHVSNHYANWPFLDWIFFFLKTKIPHCLSSLISDL